MVMTTTKGKAREKVTVTRVAPPEGPARFYNRELSWLQFNRRVLEEAENRRHPLLERLRFFVDLRLDLDEFYMVRVAGIYGQIAAGVTTLSQDGLTPAQQLVAINKFVTGLVRDQRGLLDRVRGRIGGCRPSNRRGGNAARAGERDWLEALFMTHVFPILMPIAVDPAHPFPFILNRGLTLVVEMSRTSDGKTMKGLIPILAQLERFTRLRPTRRRLPVPRPPRNSVSSASRA